MRPEASPALSDAAAVAKQGTREPERGRERRVDAVFASDDARRAYALRPASGASFLGAVPDDVLVDAHRNTAQLAERLQRAGTEVTTRWYERASHVTLAAAFSRPLRWLAPVLDDVEAFIGIDTGS